MAATERPQTWSTGDDSESFIAGCASRFNFVTQHYIEDIMNKVVKILVIFVAISSLSFMALMGAVTLGGPNWWGISQDLTEFSFEETVGETTTYTSTHRPSVEKVKTSEVMAEVVVAAMKKEEQLLTAREQELDSQITSEQNNVQALKNFQEKDVAALVARAEEFSQQLIDINTNISETNLRIAEILEKTQDQGKVVGERREDVLRLRDQLALLRTDQDRLTSQKQELENILVLLKASIAQMERRSEQLQNQN